jgi:hypothetical protein
MGNNVNFKGKTTLHLTKLLERGVMLEAIVDAYGALMSQDYIYAENVLRSVIDECGGLD